MGSFRRSLFGYRRMDVEETIAAREAEILGLQARLSDREGRLAGLENETTSLSGMVVEREREIRILGERLREANECHDRSIASLDAVTERLEELQAQARGQATRIRMKALREAVEVSRKVQALTDAHEEPAEAPTNGLYEGDVKLEIGPLGDFSQLVGFEDAVGKLASEISIERFSEGRATLSMRLDQPTELLRELEELSSLDFKVRHTAPGNLVLDLDDEQDPEQRAA
jgi:chromosome segregation ATPase